MQQANKYEHRTEKEIVFWIHDGKSVVKIFNGKEHGTITSQEKKEHINRSWQYDELLVPYDGKEADIEANYHAYIQSIDKVKQPDQHVPHRLNFQHSQGVVCQTHHHS